MPAQRYVALLRGINVGGRNPVAMSELRAVFEDAGHCDVRTYIQSGNVVFTTDRRAATLEDELEAMLERRFGVPLTVVVRSRAQFRLVVEGAPDGFAGPPGTYHCDVVLLKAPVTAAGAMRVVRLREGVDEAWAGKGVLYFRRLSARRTESRMSKIMGTPEYRSMTVRNWRTTTALLGMLDD